MHSIVDNYPALKELWTWSLDNCSDTEMKARIRGVDYHMMKFGFFYGLALGERILRHGDSLRINLSAAEEQSIESMTVNTLSNLRSEKQFDLFWADDMSKAEVKDIEETSLPRHRAVPAKLVCGTAAPEYFQTPKQLYRAYTMRLWISSCRLSKIGSINATTMYT